MRRKNDKHERDLEGIAQRLRSERPEASPLELDQIKTTAMSRAKAATGRANPRRLVVAALTVGLLAAGTGGVLAAGGSGSPAGNAAQAQYSSTNIVCDANNNNGDNNGSNNGGNNGDNNGGNNGNNQNNNFNCNNDSFNNSGNTVNNVTNNYFSSSTVTITASQTANGGVAGVTITKKAKTSSRHIRIHVRIPRKGKLRRVSVSVNGKHLKTIKGKKASANLDLVNLPCGNGATTVEITVTLSNGKTVKERHQYHLCTA